MLRFVPIGGFLGAGKTTTMLSAAAALESAGERVSVVTNDQGVDLIDSQLAAAAQLPGTGEVTGGCFCCRFDDLAAVIADLERTVAPSVVLAEAVGSCTDLQSTVVRPLRRLYGDRLSVAPLTVVLDPERYQALDAWRAHSEAESDLSYLFRHQLDEADIIAINKVDLFTAEQIKSLQSDLAERFPHARVVLTSATSGQGTASLIESWSLTVGAAEHSAFEIDYGRYGNAEAELAWTNQNFVVEAAEGFAVPDWVATFLRELATLCGSRAATIGHVKIRLVSEDGPTKASLTGAGPTASFDEQHWVPARSAEASLNARVRIDPDNLDLIIADAARVADERHGTRSSARQGDIFRPGFPVPVHRM